MARTRAQWKPGAIQTSVVLIVAVIAITATVGVVTYYWNRSDLHRSAQGTPAAEMHYRTGLALARAGNISGAANEWQTAIGLDAGYAPAHLALVSKAEQEGDYAGAVKQLDALHRAAPGTEHILCRQAALYLRANRYETALAAAQVAAKAEPECAQAHTVLGATLGRAGDWSGAVQQLQRADQLAPGLPAIAMALAVALGHAGKADQGIALLESLPASDRDSPQARYRHAWLLAEYGRKGHKDDRQALSILNGALVTHPMDPKCNAEAGRILLRQGDLVQGRMRFERALRADTANAQAARGMATIFAREKAPEAHRAKVIADRLERSEAALRSARGRFLTNPDDAVNNLGLAELEARSGNRDDALDLITRDLQADPNNAAALGLFHRLTGTNDPK